MKISKILTPYKVKSLTNIFVDNEIDNYINDIPWFSYLTTKDHHLFYDKTSPDPIKSKELRMSLKSQIRELMRRNNIKKILK